LKRHFTKDCDFIVFSWNLWSKIRLYCNSHKLFSPKAEKEEKAEKAEKAEKVEKHKKTFKTQHFLIELAENPGFRASSLNIRPFS
jgi:hypothetical protein